MALSVDVLPVVMPASNMAGPAQGQWTYDDYAQLPVNGDRYELIQGVLYMTPSATDEHQAANNLFQTYLTMHVQFTGLGRVYGPPFDVLLAPHTTVQPDVLVVLTPHLGKITARGVMGAPDLVVEIASPSTAGYDRREKQNVYAAAGVAEYWIADVGSKTVEVLLLEQHTYRSLGVFRGQAILPSTIVPNLPVQVAQFFA